MRRVVFPWLLAMASIPALAEGPPPSVEEVWRIVQEQRAEIERLRKENDRIRGEIGELTKSRAQRLQTAQNLPGAVNVIDPPPAVP